MRLRFGREPKPVEDKPIFEHRDNDTLVEHGGPHPIGFVAPPPLEDDGRARGR